MPVSKNKRGRRRKEDLAKAVNTFGGDSRFRVTSPPQPCSVRYGGYGRHWTGRGDFEMTGAHHDAIMLREPGLDDEMRGNCPGPIVASGRGGSPGDHPRASRVNDRSGTHRPPGLRSQHGQGRIRREPVTGEQGQVDERVPSAPATSSGNPSMSG